MDLFSRISRNYQNKVIKKGYCLGSGIGSHRNIRVYWRNLYKLFIRALVKRNKLGGHCHDLHMLQIQKIPKIAAAYLVHLGKCQKFCTRSRLKDTKKNCANKHENIIKRDYKYSALKISTETSSNWVWKCLKNANIL